MQTEQLPSLVAQRDALDVRIKQAQHSAKAEVFKTAAQAFALHGISREEVVAHFSKTNSTAGTKVPPKYRQTDTGKTWTGRGKQPTWFSQHLVDSGDIERLEGGAA